MKQEQLSEPVQVNGHSLRCPVCSGHQFFTRKALLNSRVRTFFNLDWTDRSATCYVCVGCSYIFWFLKK